MTTQTETRTNSEAKAKSSLLSKVLRADGVFALISGSLAIIVAGPIASVIGLSEPLALVVLGVVLLGYAAMLLYFAGREPQNQTVARLAIVLNLLWVVGSYGGLLLGLFPVNSAGKWAIALVAEAVFIFAALEIYALWRIARESH